MKIKELRELGYLSLYERAIENAEKYGRIYDEETDLNWAFDWSRTPEKHTFWACIHIGDFHKAKELIPDLLKNVIEDDRMISIQSNGLFR